MHDFVPRESVRRGFDVRASITGFTTHQHHRRPPRGQESHAEISFPAPSLTFSRSHP